MLGSKIKLNKNLYSESGKIILAKKNETARIVRFHSDGDGQGYEIKVDGNRFPNYAFVVDGEFDTIPNCSLN